MMPDAVALSVIIPAHNSEDTIEAAVESVFGQGVDGVEVIVVDDGSQVEIASVLRDLKSRSKVRVLRQSNLGASVARNRGLSEARGDHIMFVDADDLLVGGSLGGFLQAAQSSMADVVVADFVLRSDGEERLIRALNTSRVDFDEQDRVVLQWLTLARVGFGHQPNIGLLGAPWAKISRRSFLTEQFGSGPWFTPDVPRGQDVLFNTEVFGKAERVHYWAAPSYIYSVSATSSSHRVTDEFPEKVERLVDATSELLDRQGWQSLHPALAKMVVTLLEEALLRAGTALSQDIARDLLNSSHFSAALIAARLRDFSRAGKVKLVAFRAGPTATVALMKSQQVLKSVRRAGRAAS